MLNSNHTAEVAQLVEQPIRNRQVDGSNPPLGSSFFLVRPGERVTGRTGNIRLRFWAKGVVERLQSLFLQIDIARIAVRKTKT